MYFACFAVTFPAQWHGRPSLCVWSSLPEMICEKMKTKTPRTLEQTHGERSGLAGRSRVVLAQLHR